MGCNQDGRVLVHFADWCILPIRTGYLAAINAKACSRALLPNVKSQTYMYFLKRFASYILGPPVCYGFEISAQIPNETPLTSHNAKNP